MVEGRNYSEAVAGTWSIEDRALVSGVKAGLRAFEPIHQM